MTNVEVKQLENSEVELSGELPAEQFEKYRKNAIEKLGKEVEISGFRKGHVPENVLQEKLGEDQILSEMAHMALSDAYPGMLMENKIEPLGQPRISLTKVAANNPLGFKITIATMPDITLPDYKTIASEVFAEEEKVEVEDKEVEDTVLELRKRQALSQNKELSPEDLNNEENLPEMNDEFAKTLGEFETVDDLKKKLRENIEEEKKRQAKEKKRVGVMEKLGEATDISLPQVLVEGELDRMMAEFKGRVEQVGGTLEDYLKHTEKTEEQMRSEWTTDAQKRVTTQLLLNEIARTEEITPDKEQVEQQVTLLKGQYPDTPEDRIRSYIELVLTNEKVFEFLENQAS